MKLYTSLLFVVSWKWTFVDGKSEAIEELKASLVSTTEFLVRPDSYSPNVLADAAAHLDGYTAQAYQYGMSSRPDLCQPKVIVKPENGDVGVLKKIVKHCYLHGISIATRSSGHQFGGYSSTNGNNIQVDMKSGTRSITMLIGKNTHLELVADLNRSRR